MSLSYFHSTPVQHNERVKSISATEYPTRPGHHPHWTRREFLQTGGSLLGAAALALGLPGRTATAAKPGSGVPVQLPYYSPILSSIFELDIPFFLPGEVDPFAGGSDPVSDPSTIWGFNGMLGLIEADGVGQEEDGTLRRWSCDVRFMKGVFIDRQGAKQRGAFSFMWLDVFEDPSSGPRESDQIHDVNPGDLNVPGQPNYFVDGGVFWTSTIPVKSVTSHPGKGDAQFTLTDHPQLEYFTATNAILRDGPDPVAATADLNIQWTGTGERIKVVNPDQGFAGQYENATGNLTWSFTTAENQTFDSGDPAEANITHAFTCHLRNGAFFP